MVYKLYTLQFTFFFVLSTKYASMQMCFFNIPNNMPKLTDTYFINTFNLNVSVSDVFLKRPGLVSSCNVLFTFLPWPIPSSVHAVTTQKHFIECLQRVPFKQLKMLRIGGRSGGQGRRSRPPTARLGCTFCPTPTVGLVHRACKWMESETISYNVGETLASVAW